MDAVSQLLADLAAHRAAEAHLAQVRFGNGPARKAALAAAHAAVERNICPSHQTLDVELPSSSAGSPYDSINGGA